jgi:hypothetical protein
VELLEANPNPKVLTKNGKVINIKLLELPGAKRLNPPNAWLQNFVFFESITYKYAVRIGGGSKGKTFGVLPFIKFQDGQIVTCTKSGWMRGETQRLLFKMLLEDVQKRRSILRKKHSGRFGPKAPLTASYIDDSYGVSVCVFWFVF